MPSPARTLALLVACFGFGAVSPASAAGGRPDRLADHVVLITVDGLPAYLVDDPSAVLPNLRSLAARGVRADGMAVSNPSVTWPNHTTLVTGVRPARHGVLFNGLLVRPGLGLPVEVDPRRDKTELVKVPTVYDALHAAGRSAAEVNWPCTRNAAGLSVRFPDSPDTFEHATPELVAELTAGGVLTTEAVEGWSRLSGPARDRVWTRAACHVLKTRKPDLLLLHLLNVDGTHHKHGARSPAGYTAVAYADACVGEVLRAVEEAGIAGRTAVIVTSDHGFAPIPETVRPNVLFRQAGLLTVAGKKVETARAYAVPEGGTALVYLTVPDTADEDREAVLGLLKGREGIARVLTPEEYGPYGLPTPAEDRQAPDLVLAAAEGYGFAADAAGEEYVVAGEGTPGAHGFLSDDPQMNAAFVAAGAGVRRGVAVGVVDNVDVAPTVARLLGVELPDVDGEPLAEILEEGDGR